MESNRALLGIPGDGQSRMSICIVVHVRKVACKYVDVLLAFAGYLVPVVVGHVMLEVPFIKHPLCYDCNIIFCWGVFPYPFTIPSPHKTVRLFDL